MTDYNERLLQMGPFLDQHTDAEIREAIGSEDFSPLVNLPIAERDWLAANPDAWTDVWWYVDIRKEQVLEAYPCVHIAYAMSSHTNHLIEKSNGVYALKTFREREEGIVIGYCPWCAKVLNTSAWYARDGVA